MHTNITAHEAWFTAFAAKYCRATAQRREPSPLQLKTGHSMSVLAHARLLVQAEAFTPDIARAALLSALYHDVARFPQYLRYGTFKDSLSANHGLWGTRIVKKHRRLEDESVRVRILTLAGVALHNRFALPTGLPPDVRLVTDVVRDADKLDILRVMVAHTTGTKPYNGTVVLHVPDNAALWSPKVLDHVLHGRVPAYADLTSMNDLRVLLCSWMYDLRFAATRHALARSGLVPCLLAQLPDTDIFQAVKARLMRQLEALNPLRAVGIAQREYI